MFSGDTLFCGGPGATGRSYSDFTTIVASIRARLLTLPPETVVHTGHGDTTTIGAEAPDLEEWLRRGKLSARSCNVRPVWSGYRSLAEMCSEGRRRTHVPSPSHYRNGRNAARSSVANRSGSSQAAKWPPLSTSLK